MNYLTNPFCTRKIKEAHRECRVAIPIIKQILQSIFGESSKDGVHSNISQERISEKVGISRMTVNKAIKAMVSADLITSTKAYVERADGLLRRTTNRMVFKALDSWNKWRARVKREAKNAVNIVKCKREPLSPTISKAGLQQDNITKERPALRASSTQIIDLRTGELLNYRRMDGIFQQ